MKVKTKGLTLSVLIIFFIGMLGLLFGLFGGGGRNFTAYAANSTDLYNIYFDYNYYRGTYENNCKNLVESESHVLISKELTCFDSRNKYPVSFQIYGEYYNSTTSTLESGGYIGSDMVTIKANSKFDRDKFEIKNSNGEVVQTGGSTCKATNLADGLYSVTFTGVSEWKEETNIRDHPRAVKIVCTFQFRVDESAPTISGASVSTTGKYTNSAFTVSASDSGCGVSRVYYQSPNSSVYSSVASSSVRISNGSVNGLYKFYAEDKLGNVSETYYVNFDDTAPTLDCLGTGFGSATNGTFVVLAEDNSGNATLYYKLDDGNWVASGDRFSSSSNSEDGTYYFYAQDSYGNKTEEFWVQIGAELCGKFVKSSEDNSVYFTWERPTWKATLDGTDYTKNTWIRSEGEHTIKLMSDGNSAEYKYTIDHYYATSVIDASCTESGYTTYDCRQCGDSYTVFSAEELGHYYVASTVAATCTSGGYTVYTCTRCGDSYRDNETHKLGHIYLPSIKTATCTEGGYTKYSCTRCGGSYTSGETQALGHNYVTTTCAATCEEGSYTLHECSRCGDSYKDNISQPLGHNYITSVIPPTCTEYGKTKYACQVCGYEYVDDDGTYPTGHNYTSTVTKSPTCTDDGIRLSTCDNCGDSYETKISANGHSYSISDIKSSNGKTTRTYTCTVCAHSYEQELGDQYEEVTNYVEYLFEQYSPYMWWVLLATAGVWSIVMGVFFAIAQKNEDKEKSKKMIVNYVIGLVVIAIIVVACPYLIRGIAALVT